jgi:hypothetical protein
MLAKEPLMRINNNEIVREIDHINGEEPREYTNVRKNKKLFLLIDHILIA